MAEHAHDPKAAADSRQDDVCAIPGIGPRLFGARLVAGFVDVGDGALLTDMSERDYDLVERGQRPVDKQQIERACDAYEVSENFLVNGNATTPPEVFADRIAEVYRLYQLATGDFEFQSDQHGREVDEYELWGSMLQRLRAIRKAAGHMKPQDAAKAHGWKGRPYFDHETGAEYILPGRLVGYSIAMGARPEYGVLGLGEMRETESPGWAERQASEAIQHSKGPA